MRRRYIITFARDSAATPFRVTVDMRVLAVLAALFMGSPVLFVAVTAGSDEKLERCRELGAEITVNYRTEDFTERLRAEGGADLILDIMGGSYLDANLRSLTTNGRLVIIGLMGGRRSEIDLGRMLAKRLSVQATTLRSRPEAEKAAIVSGVLEQVWPLVEGGAIRPVVDRTLPLRDAAEAHRVMESSAHTGKILLTR
jgi:NADPH:quinone reductase-like Zn-dependent oxidoreductase